MSDTTTTANPNNNPEREHTMNTTDLTTPLDGKLLQHLCATNDRNGNPRRCFAIYNADGTLYDVLDEGYSGRPVTFWRFTELPSVTISATEYRAWLKRGSGMTCEALVRAAVPAAECLSLVLSGVAANEDEARDRIVAERSAR